MNLDRMFHNGVDPYATVGAVLHIPWRNCQQIIATDFKIFYVLSELHVGNNWSISYDILYFTQVLWELF